MYTYIEDIDDLAYLNREFLFKEYLGVDTEFRRTNKENMVLALLQINDEDETYLIDTLAIHNPEEHAEFLFSDSVTKIFHSCKEDIEAIYAWTNKKIVNIFDTQVANSLLNGDHSIGYQNLVLNKLGITLEKKETRSNWMRRPLSDAQLKYAALDVEYLIYIYKDQFRELSVTEKLLWNQEETETIIANVFNLPFSGIELDRMISKSEENAILSEFNSMIQTIAHREKINPTLFFSKKMQKDFLRYVFINGMNKAFAELTSWRKNLIQASFSEIIK